MKQRNPKKKLKNLRTHKKKLKSVLKIVKDNKIKLDLFKLKFMI